MREPFLRGSTYWVAFYVDGCEVRESAKTSDRKKAERYLKRRLDETAVHNLTGAKFITKHDRRRTIADLAEALWVHFTIEGKASTSNQSGLRRVERDFGASTRALALTDKTVRDYIAGRQAKGDPPASINRTTQLLGQAFRLAKLPAPEIPHLSEKGNERKGFFSQSEILRVMSNLPQDVADFTEFGWHTGMRKGEIASLLWSDIEGDVVVLRAANAKNGESRSIPLEGQLSDLITRRRRARQVTVTGALMLSDLIFHREGVPIREFRKSWSRACCLAGLGRMVCPTCRETVDAVRVCAKCGTKWKHEELKYEGRLFHDLRRSAVRDMIRGGTSQAVAMSLSGHKTDSMFRRYNIVDERDKRKALADTQLHRQKQAEQQAVIAAVPSRPN